MIIPPSSSILNANPHFAALHTHLKTILTPSGLTKSTLTSSTILSSALTTTTRPLLKLSILLRALEDLDILHDLNPLIRIISSYISLSTISALPPDTDSLLSQDVTLFRTNLPTITGALTTNLAIIHTSLSLSNPLNSTSALNATISELSTDISESLADLSSRYSVYLDAHVVQIEEMVRDLETVKHGTQARFTASRARYLKNVARGLECKAKVMILERKKEIGGEGRLLEEMERMQVEEVRWGKRERELEGMLREYELEGGRDGLEVFQVLGERFAEVEGEIEVVKREIEELETRVWRGR